MTIYSHSRLSTFETCPLKFKFKYIDKLEAEYEESVEAFLGKRVHETLEKLYKDLKFGKLNTLQELLKYYNDEWKKNWNEAILIVRKEYDQENFRKKGEEFITNFYERYKPFDQEKTIATEKLIMINLDEEKKYRLRGYIDRISTDGTTYFIRDYKTSSSLPTQESIEKDRQLTLYAMAVKKDFQDCERVVCAWHYLAFDKELKIERDNKDFEQLKEEIKQLIDKIESAKDFPAKASALCDWCEFRPHCPQFKHLYELEQKTPNEYLKDDGVTLVNKYAELKEQEKELGQKMEKVKEALTLLAKEKGIEVVYGSDVKARIKTYPRLSFPKKKDIEQEDFFKAVKIIGLWDKLATVDVYELAKMINNGELHEDLVKVLDKFIKKGEITRIYLNAK